MKRYKLSFVLIVLLISITLLGSFSVKSLGAETLDFTFEKDVLYSESNPEYYESFNVRNQSEYSGHYPATYSFENDENNENPNNFIITEGNADDVKVVSSNENHDKVIRIVGSDSAHNGFIQYFDSSIETGVIEFWIKYIDLGDDEFRMTIHNETGIEKVRLLYQYDVMYVYDGVTQTSVMDPVLHNWTHIKLEIYADVFDVYVNNVLEADGFSISDDADINALSYLRFYVPSWRYNVIVFVDAIGYSWGKTYNFNDDLVGSEPERWDINNDDDCISIIKDSLDDRTKVLELYDNSDIGIVNVSKEIKQTANQSIEFEIAKESILAFTTMNIYFKENNNKIIDLQVYTRTLTYYDEVGSGYVIVKHNFINANDFFVIKIVLNDTFNSYDIYIDNVLEKNDLDYGINTINSIDKIGFESFNEHINYRYYLDNFNISSDIPYRIGDNIIPLLETNESIKEVNRFEFLIDDYGANNFIYYDTGDDNPSGWIDIEGGGGDDVNCRKTYNGTVEIKNEGDYDLGTGIKKQDFELMSKRINITMGFELIDMASVISSHFDLYVNSSDNTEVIRIYIDKDGDLGYYDDGDNKVVLDTGLLENVFYEYNLFVHYEYGSCFFRYSADGVFVESYVFPLKESGKKGLKGIVAMLECSTTGHQVDLIYIGIYSNGNTAINDFAYIDINISEGWSYPFGKYYFDDLVVLKTLVRSNKSALYMISNNVVYQDIMAQLYSEGVHITEQTKNLFGFVFYDGEEFCYDPALRFVFKENITVDIFEVSLEGSMLSENDNDYLLEYSFGGIDVDESYFYVDSNNRLQYSLIANDDNTEFIQATFNINDIACENRSIRYSSDIEGNAYGFFSVNYIGDESVFEIPYYSATTVVILPQTKTVTSFLILITDNDLSNNAVCTGYISNIKLIYYPGLQVSIDTLSLLAVIVPLIIMIVPPIAMQKKFGTTGVFITFILMALVCVATGLIPIWLFFIIALSSVGLIAMKKEVGERL